MFPYILYTFSDGEQALIIAARALGQDNGPVVRRLVERNHANRNIEDNINHTVTDKSIAAQLIKQWFDFTDSTAQDEAEEHIIFINKLINTQPQEIKKKINSIFRVYFEDPKMICKFGLIGVPPKHFGPAESEGYQNLFKNIYTEGITSNSPPDDVLYQAYKVRQKMKFRFFEDYQNSKLPKALRTIKEKYVKENQIIVGEGAKIVSSITRKSPRKTQQTHAQEELENMDKDEMALRGTVRKALFSDSEQPTKRHDHSDNSEISNASQSTSRLYRRSDADANTPFSGKVGCTETKFSRKPKIRALQRQKMVKKYKDKIQANEEDFAKQLFKSRQRYYISSVLPEDFVSIDKTIDYEDYEQEPEILSQFSENFKPGGPVSNVDDILMQGSIFEPDNNLWNSLNAIPIYEEDTDYVSQYRYYEVSMGSSVAGSVNWFFNKCIRPSGDKTTSLKKVAFKYVKRRSRNMPYISLIGMTNKGIMGNKRVPFTFQCILPAGKIEQESEINQLEGVWCITPEYISIADNECNRKPLNCQIDTTTRNNLVECLVTQYQLEDMEEEEEEDSEGMLYDCGVLVNTYAIAKVKIGSGKQLKEAMVLVKIITTGKQFLTLEVFKEHCRNKKIWSKMNSRTVYEKREVILASAIAVTETPETLELKQTPQSIWQKLSEAYQSNNVI